MVEHSAVNRGVVGSSPTRGANRYGVLPFNGTPVSKDTNLDSGNREPDGVS